MFWLLGTALATSPTYVDFDGVDVNATAPGPSIALINETLRDVCPASVRDSEDGWSECVTNLSFVEIGQICGRLGASTPEVVDELLKTARPVPVMQHGALGEAVDWRGCFWNSEGRVSLKGYRFRRAGQSWILTNIPEDYWVRDDGEQTSLTVFDGLPSAPGAPSGRSVEGLTTFAYRLIERTPGDWIAAPSETNQDRINDALHQMELSAAYCGTRHPGDPEEDCEVLPSLALRAVSPTMIVVRSLKSASVTHQVHGIFWKSVTGYDILKDAAAPDAATPDAARGK